jgi:phosphate transport system substrate-binding protein
MNRVIERARHPRGDVASHGLRVEPRHQWIHVHDRTLHCRKTNEGRFSYDTSIFRERDEEFTEGVQGAIVSFAGSSSSLPLPDLIQATAFAGRTCRVSVRGGGGAGELGFERGELVCACFQGERGDAAVLAMLALDEVDYEMEATAPPYRDVAATWQGLVLESARLRDEAARVHRRQLSSPSMKLPLPAPAVAPPAQPILSMATPPRPHGRKWLVACGAAGITATLVVALFAIFRSPGSASHAPGAAAAVAAGHAPQSATADTEPVAVVAPLPAIPLGARPGLAPTIVCRVHVEPDGSVSDATIYRPRADLVAWEAAALDSIHRWKFTPAHHDGSAIAAWVNVPVTFGETPAPAAQTIVVKGSDTIGGQHGVGPLLAAAFEKANPGARVHWEGLGSATAFVGLLDGSADVGAASRPVNATELADAERLGLRLTEYVLGYDGIAIIVHPSAPLTTIALPDLARVFTGEVTTWRQLAGPKAPDQPIRLIARPAYSGTHAFFKDKILGGKPIAPRAELVESSEDIAKAVAADPLAISFVGMAWVTPSVRALDVAPARGAAAITPDRDTIRAGTYPIYRPLLLYVRGLPSPHVADLLRFCLGPEGQALIAEHGLVPGDMPIESIVSSDAPTTAPTVALRVPFPPGHAFLDDEARIALAALATELRASPRRLTLSGHADAERGGASNTYIARRRAEAVAAFLRAHGVDGRLITVESGGDAAPVATNTTRAGRDQNRRVDIIFGSKDSALR